MLSMKCPVCRADNVESTCRRCKADLSLMCQVEQERTAELREATRLYRLGRFDEGRAHAENAWSLQADAAAARCVALGWLYQRQFAQALRYYQFAKM